MAYIPTIGIEVHVELKTKTKAFSPSLNTYGEIANSKTNVIDLGYPGTLPVLNKSVIDLAIKACIATKCHIASKIYFDRKNYFYPDLAKGYQITQNDTPIGYDGYVEIEVDGVLKKIEIERLHIEEDTSKSIHEGDSTLLDFNRAGVPLIEIVTKPVIASAQEAVLYLEKLRELLLYAGVSDVKIEEGSMRCDANVSLRSEESDTLGVKTEIKNIGSISSVKAAIDFEIDHQTKMLDNNEVIKEQTKRYDERRAETILMRTKETNADYRYFPEADIPYIFIDETWINNIKENMPIMPDEIRDKYQALGINDISINALIAHKDITLFLERVMNNSVNPTISVNLLTGDVLMFLNKHNITIDKTKLDVDNFSNLVKLIDTGEITSKMGRELLSKLIDKGGDVKTLLNDSGMRQISDEEEIRKIVEEVITSNPEVVNDYKNGNERSFKYLIGQGMKISKGQANPKILNDYLLKELNR
jgi:aspartyl-tRNA(Asn)/glutamyl-tRNA(Gln) amidotransferase subunit B